MNVDKVEFWTASPALPCTKPYTIAICWLLMFSYLLTLTPFKFLHQITILDRYRWYCPFLLTSEYIKPYQARYANPGVLPPSELATMKMKFTLPLVLFKAINVTITFIGTIFLALALGALLDPIMDIVTRRKLLSTAKKVGCDWPLHPNVPVH